MSVSISIGPQAKPFPWRYGCMGAETKLVPVVPGVPGKRVLVMAKMHTSGRVAILLGYIAHGEWWTCISSKASSPNNKVLAWHSWDEPIDADRAFKAIWWAEQNFGMVKVKNIETWFERFKDAWEYKPWA